MEISKTKVAQLASLSTKKMRKKHGLFLAEGTKCVMDMVAGFQLDCIVTTEQWLSENQFNVEKNHKIFTATPETLKKISSLSTPTEVIASFRLPEDDLMANEFDINELSLMLDGVQDPGNLGTIIRTADWFGLDKIFCSPDTVDVFNPKVVQATMGSLRRVKVIYTDLIELLTEHKVHKVYGLMLNGKDIFAEKLSESGVVVMGNEGNGLSELMKGLVSDPLFIPPCNPESHPESLNVAIATAITLSQFRH